jgi:hypothetical protein
MSCAMYSPNWTPASYPPATRSIRSSSVAMSSTMSGYWRATAPSRGARIVFAAKRDATMRTRPAGLSRRPVSFSRAPRISASAGPRCAMSSAPASSRGDREMSAASPSTLRSAAGSPFHAGSRSALAMVDDRMVRINGSRYDPPSRSQWFRGIGRSCRPPSRGASYRFASGHAARVEVCQPSDACRRSPSNTASVPDWTHSRTRRKRLSATPSTEAR